MEEEYSKSALNLRLETHRKNDVIYVTIPKNFCKKFNLTGKDSEEIELVIHTIYKDYKAIDLCRIDLAK
jgi:hypothetical protein